VSAADAFLASLDANQRQQVLYAFDDNEQRARWSNFPTGVVPRGIQGPHLVIEYALQHDEPTNHVHTIYRDPTNDYGRAKQ
jgi:hypothetical protein